MASARDVAHARDIITKHVKRTYFHNEHLEAWRSLPEIPTKDEINPIRTAEEICEEKYGFEEWDEYQKDPVYDPKLPQNIIKGPWPSKLEYLGAHYQMLREDIIANLRASVKEFKKNPSMNDSKSTCVYTKLTPERVHIVGVILSPQGAGFRVSFSHERAGQQIRWEQSNRLTQGSMLALSTERDMFASICKMVIVAARPIVDGLDKDPPTIDLFFASVDDMAFDPAESYILLESRSGYFEASRHMLVALQKVAEERFILAQHLVDVDLNVGPPAYLEDNPFLNLTSLAQQKTDPAEALGLLDLDDDPLQRVNVLEGFPEISNSGMDRSQMQACERMLTKKVAIVQGPPGTGKTFTSISAIKALIENNHTDTPIIVAAQTNHALDQLLNRILNFEPNILRLGGRCDKENVEILKRTLYSLRMATPNCPGGNAGIRSCRKQLENKVIEIQAAMMPLLDRKLLTDDFLLSRGVISQAQRDSLYDDDWTSSDDVILGQDGEKRTPLETWLGEGQVARLETTPHVNLGLPMEEIDLEFEQLQELELESPNGQADKDIDAMQGVFIEFQRQLTGNANLALDEKRIRKMLRSQNLYSVPAGNRGSVYRYFERVIDRQMEQQLKVLFQQFQAIVDEYKITKWETNFRLIRHLGIKVVGCTTTGLSKYRGLLSALDPRTLLIEEAAETLEGTVIAGMFDSLEQLILVGDHQQLQAHCNVGALEDEPYYLSISMFERLILNSLPFTMLNEQRRMISDVRKLLCIEPEPFYRNLHDHPSVLDRANNRAPVPGMGGRDTYFFHHTWPESRNPDSSRYNLDEAEMIAGFFNYLVLNGVEHAKITVLTFYNGQRKTILKELKKHPGLQGNTYFNVFTVDSYQGEENDVILLSLVRSNEYLNIGFLESKNRLVVALSRARRGLYIFGNAVTLTTAETNEEVYGRDPLWRPVIRHMKQAGQFRLDGGLPITCINHGNVVRIFEADNWHSLTGGCETPCGGLLDCGHPCPHKCHPFSHSQVICRAACATILSCGHGCSNFCGEGCSCSVCDNSKSRVPADQVEGWGASDGGSEYSLNVSRDNRRRATSGRETPVWFTDRESPKKDSRFISSHVRNEVPGRRAVSFLNQRNSPSPPKRPSGSSPGRGPSFAIPRNGNPYSREGFASPPGRAALPQKSPGSIEKWKAWDAKKADTVIAERTKREDESAAKLGCTETVFNETFRPTKTTEDGKRVKKGEAEQRLVSGAKELENFPPLSPAAGPPPTMPSVGQVLHDPFAFANKAVKAAVLKIKK